jgi:uncharacterized membrane protein YgaE (UPF0421/DUF939 family)
MLSYVDAFQTLAVVVFLAIPLLLLLKGGKGAAAGAAA